MGGTVERDRCENWGKERVSSRVNVGEGTDHTIGQTCIDAEGALCESGEKSEGGDGERGTVAIVTEGVS
jgi:hypothetical protein